MFALNALVQKIYLGVGVGGILKESIEGSVINALYSYT